jgi:hypothetical protein
MFFILRKKCFGEYRVLKLQVKHRRDALCDLCDRICAVPKIFISYRRDETAGYAGRIHERLAAIYGGSNVFMDIDDIGLGSDFVNAIDEHIATCDVVLVLIGKQWLVASDAQGRRRIEDPADFVRLEVLKALQRKVRIIPVLLNKAAMPAPDELPSELKPLARRQAVELSDERWDYDLAQLAKAAGGATRKPSRRKLLLAGAALLILVAAIVWTFLRFNPQIAVAGRWSADVPYEFSAPRRETFVFEVNGRELTGTASFLGLGRAIADGNITGRRLTFLTRTMEISGDERRETIHRYKGEIAGEEIRFVMQTEGGVSEHPPIAFQAKREGSSRK